MKKVYGKCSRLFAGMVKGYSAHYDHDNEQFLISYKGKLVKIQNTTDGDYADYWTSLAPIEEICTSKGKVDWLDFNLWRDEPEGLQCTVCPVYGMDCDYSTFARVPLTTNLI